MGGVFPQLVKEGLGWWPQRQGCRAILLDCSSHVYNLHQKNGFTCMLIGEIFELMYVLGPPCSGVGRRQVLSMLLLSLRVRGFVPLGPSLPTIHAQPLVRVGFQGGEVRGCQGPFPFKRGLSLSLSPAPFFLAISILRNLSPVPHNLSCQSPHAKGSGVVGPSSCSWLWHVMSWGKGSVPLWTAPSWSLPFAQAVHFCGGLHHLPCQLRRL